MAMKRTLGTMRFVALGFCWRDEHKHNMDEAELAELERIAAVLSGAQPIGSQRRKHGSTVQRIWAFALPRLLERPSVLQSDSWSCTESCPHATIHLLPERRGKTWAAAEPSQLSDSTETTDPMQVQVRKSLPQ